LQFLQIKEETLGQTELQAILLTDRTYATKLLATHGQF